MKTTKRFLLTLAAILGMTGAWAQDTEEEITVTKNHGMSRLKSCTTASNGKFEGKKFGSLRINI